MRNLFKSVKSIFTPKKPKLEPLQEIPNTGCVQTDVIQYLQQGNTLTSNEALILFGTSRLAVIISRARKSGIAIRKVTITDKNRNGKTIQYAQYSIIR